jgi:hydrogenase maturation protease
VANPPAPVLVFTWGNPSRGDDALGPAIYERLQEIQSAGRLPGVDLLTDFQLQIEHALDLRERDRVLFVDASVGVAAPLRFSLLQSEPEVSFTTHAMSPGAILSVFAQVEQQPPPPSFLLSIRGYEFGLGQPLSVEANRHLDAACGFILSLLAADGIRSWHAAATEGDYSGQS